MKQEESLKKMQELLKEYKKDKTSAKPLFRSMKEISTWLSTQG